MSCADVYLKFSFQQSFKHTSDGEVEVCLRGMEQKQCCCIEYSDTRLMINKNEENRFQLINSSDVSDREVLCRISSLFEAIHSNKFVRPVDLELRQYKLSLYKDNAFKTGYLDFVKSRIIGKQFIPFRWSYEKNGSTELYSVPFIVCDVPYGQADEAFTDQIRAYKVLNEINDSLKKTPKKIVTKSAKNTF